MKESYPKNQENEPISEEEIIRELAKKALEQEKQEAPSLINTEAHSIKRLEEQFAEALDRKASKGEYMSSKELGLWESDLAHSWEKIEDIISGNDEMENSLATQAKAEFPAFQIDPTSEEYPTYISKTIEAQIGRFHHTRAEKLEQAILESNSETKQQDLGAIKAFTKLVLEHIRLKTEHDEKWETGGDAWESYDKHRTKVHNDTIRKLNELNALCEKYGTTRFTPRDFWTSDKLSSDDKDNIAARRRARHDRDIVEEYYAIAFEKEMKESEYKLMENNPQMLLDEKAKIDFFLHHDHFNGFWDDEKDESA